MTVHPKLSIVLDYKDIKLYGYFDYNKKSKVPTLYISNERLGNRFKYIFITSKTNVSRNQYAYNSDLQIVQSIKNLIQICMNNNTTYFNCNYSGSDFDDIIRILY